MADILNLKIIRHLRGDPTAHVLHYRRGRLKRSGRGLAFWLRPLGASVAEIPLDDRELPVMFHLRSADHQDVSVQGVVIFRVADPEVLAQRIDFTVDLKSGLFRDQPLDRLAGVITRLAQELATSTVARSPLVTVLEEGIEQLRDAIHGGLVADLGLQSMGLELVSTRITAVRPTSEMETALQMPTREHIQQQSDEATFARRALAVEKERAIQENELHNKVELARREEELIDRRGHNDRRRAELEAAAKRVEVESSAEAERLQAAARADATRLVEEAEVNAERERMAIYRDMPATALAGLAARELAGTLHTIQNLSLGPDMLTPLLTRIAQAGAEKLEADR